jgi:hypothetical protein
LQPSLVKESSHILSETPFFHSPRLFQVSGTTMSDTGALNQAEHEQISTSLEVEQIEVNLFRSKSLWLPMRARGVFGG